MSDSGFLSEFFDPSPNCDPSSVEQAVISLPRSLIVGGGGSGTRSLQWAHHFICRHYGGQPPFCEFLNLDTTAQDTASGDGDGARHTLGPSDFVSMSEFNASVYFEHNNRYPALDWLPVGNLLPGQITDGAQGVPHIGRLAYFLFRDNQIHSIVQQKLGKLTDASRLPDPYRLANGQMLRVNPSLGINIHMVGSLLGGTNAGCVLDLAYNLRKWCMEFTAIPPRVFGHLFLPGTFNFMKVSSTTRDLHRTNAYLRLCEINHFMGKHRAQVRYMAGETQDWRASEAPFDYCFLIDGASSKTTTSQEDAFLHTGHAIALMATRYAGVRLGERLVNIRASMLERSTSDALPSVYSSYGLAEAGEPQRQLIIAALKLLYEQCVQTAPRELERVPQFSPSWEGFDKCSDDSLRTLNKSFSSNIDGAVGNHTKFEQVARAYLRACPDLAHRQAMRDFAQRDGQPIDEAYRMWHDGNDFNVLDLPLIVHRYAEALTVFAGGLTNGNPSPFAASIEQFITAPGARSPEEIEELKKDVALLNAEHLKTAWKGVVAAKAKEMETRADAMKSTADLLAQGWRSTSFHEQRAQDASIYAISAPVMDKFVTECRPIIKRLVWEAVLEERMTDPTPASCRAALTETMSKGSGGIRVELKLLIDSTLEGIVWNTKSDADTSVVRVVQEGMNVLYDVAEPRWQVPIDVEVENANILVHPSAIKSDLLKTDQFAQQVEVLEERDTQADSAQAASSGARGILSRASAREASIAPSKPRHVVVMLRSEHGAALTDLMSFENYYAAFQRTVARRKARRAARAKNAPVDEASIISELWLDKRWGVQPVVPTNRPRDEHQIDPAAWFAFFSGTGLVTINAHGFVLQGRDGESDLTLGESVSMALEAWTFPDHQPRIERVLNRERNRPLNDLIADGRIAFEWLNEQVSTSGDNDRQMYLRMRDALMQLVTHWQTLQQAAGPAAGTK